MVDLTMCATRDCPLEWTCKRKTNTPSENQSYSLFGEDSQVECKEYIMDAAVPKSDSLRREPGRMDIADGCPVSAIEWAQPPGDMSDQQQSLRLALTDAGDGAYFRITTGREGFALDSGDDLRKLADFVDELLPAYTSADVY